MPPARTPIAATFLAALVTGAACSEQQAADCPTGYARDATGRCCAPQGTCIGDPAQQCGANALRVAGTCVCSTPWQDCDGDLGGAGGNGCECNGECAGTQCNAPTGCSPTTPGTCSRPHSTCDPVTKACQSCPPGGYDCDGLGGNGCESNDATCGAGGCSPTARGACAMESQYCDPETRRCVPCPGSAFNCDRTGQCESPTACDATVCEQDCLDEAEIYCLKDQAQGNRCVPCLEDGHCQANPRSRGPTCDKALRLCVCTIAEDCAGDTSGTLCKQAGSAKACGCDDDVHCMIEPYTKCSPAVFGKCIKPCQGQADCPDGQDCDLASGQCYDIGP